MNALLCNFYSFTIRLSRDEYEFYKSFHIVQKYTYSRNDKYICILRFFHVQFQNGLLDSLIVIG